MEYKPKISRVISFISVLALLFDFSSLSQSHQRKFEYHPQALSIQEVTKIQPALLNWLNKYEVDIAQGYDNRYEPFWDVDSIIVARNGMVGLRITINSDSIKVFEFLDSTGSYFIANIRGKEGLIINCFVPAISIRSLARIPGVIRIHGVIDYSAIERRRNKPKPDHSPGKLRL
jgi:hypothetical protein